MKVNYQLVLDKKIEELKGTIPTLLLHSCCGPCSTYVLEYLSKYFKITVVYYNPNIFPQEEYEHRLREQKKVVENMPFENPVDLIFEDYQHNDFIKNIKGLRVEQDVLNVSDFVLKKLLNWQKRESMTILQLHFLYRHIKILSF